jgi:hypothetical protein
MEAREEEKSAQNLVELGAWVGAENFRCNDDDAICRLGKWNFMTRV